MNLLTTLRTSSAAAMDAIRDIAARAGVDANVSVILSHPGTVEDSFVIGLHDFAELRAILDRVEHGQRVECDVTSTAVGPETITPAPDNPTPEAAMVEEALASIQSARRWSDTGPAMLNVLEKADALIRCLAAIQSAPPPVTGGEGALREALASVHDAGVRAQKEGWSTGTWDDRQYAISKREQILDKALRECMRVMGKAGLAGKAHAAGEAALATPATGGTFADGVEAPHGCVLVSSKPDEHCGCPEEEWETPWGYLFMHLNTGEPSDFMLDLADDGEIEIEIIAPTVEQARRAGFAWASIAAMIQHAADIRALQPGAGRGDGA